jgi:hypothetical protein
MLCRENIFRGAITTYNSSIRHKIGKTIAVEEQLKVTCRDAQSIAYSWYVMRVYFVPVSDAVFMLSGCVFNSAVPACAPEDGEETPKYFGTTSLTI